MIDGFNRNIEYMRISITDRCNLRCRYCMPKGIKQLPMKDILTYEEIRDIAEAAVSIGIVRFKITGGEPLVRLGCENLIEMIHEIPGVQDITLTTNGILLADKIDDLVSAGISAINISLDSLKAERFNEITGFDKLLDVVKAIDIAAEKDIKLKINVVLQKGCNDDEWMDFVELARDRKLDVRFIEMMPIGYGKKIKGIGNDELIEMLCNEYPETKKDDTVHGNGPAAYYHIDGFKGSIGFISAIHGKFCDNCNRIRMTSKGKIKPCLCYNDEVSLTDALKIEKREERISVLAELIKSAIDKKPESHVFLEPDKISEARRMSDIGG